MNVNLDVLELIFAELHGADLVSTAQVSRAFLAGAIPSLYARIEYTLRHVKRAHAETSPFATLAAHDHLGVHVKRIALHAAPAAQHSSAVIDPAFLRDLASALQAAPNLRAFICTAKILAPLIPLITDKQRLHHVRANAIIASRQLAFLLKITGLHSLALDFPSWHVIDALPSWTVCMHKTLAHLTLTTAQDLDATILNATLAQLPRLRGLHVIGCPRIAHTVVLKALFHTPDLRELSFTIFPSQPSAEDPLPPLNFPTPPLTHLSIDVRASYPRLISLIARIIACLCPTNALAICGGWIGEIKASSERSDPPPDSPENGPDGPAPAAPQGQNFPFLQGQFHIPPPQGHDHGNNLVNDPPLLSPPAQHNGNTHPHPNLPNPGNLPLSTLFGITFPFGNLTGNGGPPGGPPNHPDQDFHPDPLAPSLVESLPSTLSVLHLPQISPAGLREVVSRCERIQVLGVVMGRGFGSSFSTKSGKNASRPTTSGRSKESGHATKTPSRVEVGALADILSRAASLRELIIDTSPAHIANIDDGSGMGPRHGALSSCALLRPPDVRKLMRVSPRLRRIVGEGRVWESSTPAPVSPVPFPHCLPINITHTRARFGPGMGNGHGHGPPSFGTLGGGYTQMEASSDHWFWLTGSASGGGRVRSGS